MKLFSSLIAILFYIQNLFSQSWDNIVTSNQNFYYFNSASVDTISNTMYLGGLFDGINNIQTKGIIKYNGVNFDSLSSGLTYTSSAIQQPVTHCLKMFQNKLYVAGIFEKAGKYSLNNFARWNGSDWDSINFKLHGSISSMIVYNNELYVAGVFDSIGGNKSYNIAKYDGTNWYNVGQSYSPVTSIESFNSVLYRVGGDSAGVPCSDIEYFNGTNWIPWACVYGGVTKSVSGIKTIDSMLYVYGKFDNIVGVNCRGLAAWDGSIWHSFNYGTTLGGFTNSFIKDVSKIQGNIYVSALGDSINDELLSGYGIAKYDGTKWCRFMSPINGLVNFSIDYNDSLFFGGTTLIVGGSSPANGLIKWTGGQTTIFCELLVSVNEIRLPYLSIYPNPTTSIINIVDENNQFQNATIQITNYLGQVVFISPFTNQIDLRSLSSGMYFLTIFNKEKRQTNKFIKQ